MFPIFPFQMFHEAAQHCGDFVKPFPVEFVVGGGDVSVPERSAKVSFDFFGAASRRRHVLGIMAIGPLPASFLKVRLNSARRLPQLRAQLNIPVERGALGEFENCIGSGDGFVKNLQVFGTMASHTGQSKHARCRPPRSRRHIARILPNVIRLPTDASLTATAD